MSSTCGLLAKGRCNGTGQRRLEGSLTTSAQTISGERQPD